MLKKILIRLTLTLIILASAIYALFTFKGKDYIEKLIIQTAKNENLDLKLKLSHLGFQGLVFQSIEIFNKAVYIEKIEIGYSLKLLREKKIQEINISGVKLDLNKIETITKWIDSRPASNDKTATYSFDLLIVEISQLKLPNDQNFTALDNLKIEMNSKQIGKLDLKFENPRFTYEGKVFSNLKLAAHLNFNLQASPHFRGMINLEAIYLNKGLKIKVPNLVFINNELNLENSFITFDQYQIPVKKLTFNRQQNILNLKIKGLKENVSLAQFTPLDIDLQGKKDEIHWHLPFQIHSSWQKNMITGLIEMSDEEQNIKFKLVDLNFSKLPNGLLSLYPALKEKIQIPSGHLKMDGKAKIKNEKYFLSLNIEGADLDLNYEDIKVRKIHFKQQLTDLLSLKSKANQKIKIKEMDLGFILKNIELDYQLKGSNLLLIDSLSLDSEYGKISTKKFQIKPEPLEVSLVPATLTGISLQKVLAMALKEDVEATGDLSGYLNLEFKNKIPVIVSGKFQSNSAGIIRYDQNKNSPLSNADQVSVNILLNYLRDFHYQEIHMDVRSEQDGTFYIVMQLLGKNPKVFNGKPLKFTLNLQMNWIKLIESTIGTSQISDKLEQKILKGLKK